VAKPGIRSRHGYEASLFFAQGGPAEACGDRRAIVFALIEVLGTAVVETKYFVVEVEAVDYKT
jgi:hypothetical protein